MDLADGGDALLRSRPAADRRRFLRDRHHAQVLRDVRAAILGGRLVALTAVIGSGKTILSRRLRAELEREGRVIVSRSLTVEKAKITVPLLISALFYDLTPDKTVTISSQSERRERDLQELFKRAKKPVALFVDDAHAASEHLLHLNGSPKLSSRAAVTLSRAAWSPEAEERPSPATDGGNRRPHDRIRVRRTA